MPPCKLTRELKGLQWGLKDWVHLPIKKMKQKPYCKNCGYAGCPYGHPCLCVKIYF